MGTKLCGCNNTNGEIKDQNVYIIILLYNLFINSQLGSSKVIVLNNQEQIQEDNNNKLSRNTTEIANIILKNQAIKIQTAFRDFKKRNKTITNNTNNQTLSHYTNENNMTETGTIKLDYIGKRDSHGLKWLGNIRASRWGYISWRI